MIFLLTLLADVCSLFALPLCRHPPPHQLVQPRCTAQVHWPGPQRGGTAGSRVAEAGAGSRDG